MKKLKFKKGTRLWKRGDAIPDAGYLYLPYGTLNEDFEAEMPEYDYQSTIAGPMKVAVSSGTNIKYKDDLYLHAGDASNWKQLSDPLFGIEPDMKEKLKMYWPVIAAGVILVAGIIIFVVRKRRK